MSNSKIQLTSLLATHYLHPDLSQAHKFFTDFGFQVARRDEGRIYYRGFGEHPYVYIAENASSGQKRFVGAIWTVATRADLETASKMPGASPVQPSTAPGHGEQVELMDPNGIEITLVHGLELRSTPAEEKPDAVIMNSWEHKPRKGVFQRPERGPSKVHKIGHYGLIMDKSKLPETMKWYLDLFSLTPTDILYDPETEDDMMCFLHIDLGEDFSDHHSLFLHAAHGAMDHCTADHSSFEVDNFDSELAGHDHLEKQGWTQCWGVGRHMLGSQIFDYWFDASGFIVEHYSDGDVVNNKTKMTRQVATPENMATWGPNVSRAMLTGRIEDAEKSHKTTMIRSQPVAVPASQTM